jgi:hypothetical protein
MTQNYSVYSIRLNLSTSRPWDLGVKGSKQKHEVHVF